MRRAGAHILSWTKYLIKNVSGSDVYILIYYLCTKIKIIHFKSATYCKNVWYSVHKEKLNLIKGALQQFNIERSLPYMRELELEYRG